MRASSSATRRSSAASAARGALTDGQVAGSTVEVAAEGDCALAVDSVAAINTERFRTVPRHSIAISPPSGGRVYDHSRPETQLRGECLLPVGKMLCACAAAWCGRFVARGLG